MASIRKRNTRWQAQVRRQGRKSVTKTFLTRRDALAWARQTELQLDCEGTRSACDDLRDITTLDLLQRYLKEVTIFKRSRDREEFSIKAMMRELWCKKTLYELKTDMAILFMSPIQLFARG